MELSSCIGLLVGPSMVTLGDEGDSSWGEETPLRRILGENLDACLPRAYLQSTPRRRHR